MRLLITSRLAFVIRFSDTLQTDEDIGNLVLKRLRDFLIITEEVKILASFDSFSALLVLSLPASISAYLSRDPAVISLGPIKPGNRMSPAKAQIPSGIVKLNASLPEKESTPRLSTLPDSVTASSQ